MSWDTDHLLDGFWNGIWDAVLRIAPFVITMFLLIFIVKVLVRGSGKRR